MTDLTLGESGGRGTAGALAAWMEKKGTGGMLREELGGWPADEGWDLGRDVLLL